MKNNKLKVLSVHTSNKCSTNCPFCYLDKSNPDKERSHEWWVSFFHQVDDIEQIALAWNEQPVDEMCEYVRIAGSKDIIVNITCNHKMITNNAAIKLKEAGIRMISLSVDRFKCKTIDDVQKSVEILKTQSILTGINLLLDDDIVQHLEIIVQKLLGMGADLVYALQPKPDNLKISKEDFKAQLMLCSLIFGTKFAIDEASRLKIGKSNQCHRGSKLLSINAYGEICLCSFDSGIEAFSGKILPREVTTTVCPFL